MEQNTTPLGPKHILSVDLSVSISLENLRHADPE